MKVHLKKYAQHWLRLNDPKDPIYHPARAANYYKAHEEDIDFVRAWWARIRDEWEHRLVIKIWRKHLTNEKR